MTRIGNFIQQGNTYYAWNARNQLVGITNATMTASFKYDALGRRIEKSINGKKTQYLYDGLDIVQDIEDGMVSANYIRTLNIDEPLARIKADGTVRYYQQDALGSVVALTDESGAIKTQYVYDPFGNTEMLGEQGDQPFQYTGRENDSTGLYGYRSRYYSPDLQRFISEDPMGLRGGDVNSYVYVHNRPTMFRDPLGFFEVSPSMESTWSNYGNYGANWNEFQRERDVTPVMDLLFNSPPAQVIGSIPPGEGTGNPSIDRALNIYQILQDLWNRRRDNTSCQ